MFFTALLFEGINCVFFVYLFFILRKFNNTETYYLVIADEAGVQIPVKEEMQIDIAMAIDEFDFFS